MKRRALWWLLLPSLLIAALWPISARLNHPPLSQADLQLRAAIAGADRMEIGYFSCQQSQCSKNILMTESFNRTQMAQFRENLRFLDALSPPPSGSPLKFEVYFYRGRKQLMHLQFFVGDFSTATGPTNWRGAHRLYPRFEAKVRAWLPISRLPHDLTLTNQ